MESKQQFISYMIAKDFYNAAAIVFDQVLNVDPPEGVIVNFNIDRHKQISDLSMQLQVLAAHFEDEMKTSLPEVLLDRMISEMEEGPRKVYAIENRTLMIQKPEIVGILNKAYSDEYSRIYDLVVSSLNGLLQGLINGLSRSF